jgi:hypothetical protein
VLLQKQLKMGLFDFIKRTAKTIGHGISEGAKFIGEHAKPILHGVANAVSAVAPYASTIATALGHPEIGAIANTAGKIANGIKGMTSG